MVHLEALVSFSAETTFLRDDENVRRDVFPAYLITHPKTDSFLESLCQPQRMQFAFEFALPFTVVQYSQIDSIGVSGDKKGLHWYQSYHWYQWKSTILQWFYW